MKRRGMTKRGSAEIWAILCNAVAKRRDGFIQSLQLRVKAMPNGCVLWTGPHRGGSGGGTYPSMKFFWKGRPRNVYMHQVFLMLQTCKPLPVGMETGHYFCFNASCVRHVESQTVAHNLSLKTNGKKDSEACPF